MRTPVTSRGRAAYDHLPPLEAIVKAWTEPGPSSYWHREAQDQVRRAMPVLARALDRATSARIHRRTPHREDAVNSDPRDAQNTGQSPSQSLLQAAWEAAETPESGVIEPGQRYIARSGGGNFYTMKAVTQMSCRGLVHELRLL